MSQSYKKECIYCKNEILMSETLGKWFPLNLDNSPHVCEGKDQVRKSVSQSKVKKVEKPLTLEDLDLRLRMVESIIIKGVKK